ncbi:hypothetical protein HPP92_006677 [Vanilla planifolia]|uniref:Uncharacterized protein n=1 Tax=Vanilla planifolia TaxID=51239 RepID=A0A835REU4_VANPL|nr:hypothetical protein HPP92_006677 [Vanilla planifolia]
MAVIQKSTKRSNENEPSNCFTNCTALTSLDASIGRRHSGNSCNRSFHQKRFPYQHLGDPRQTEPNARRRPPPPADAVHYFLKIASSSTERRNMRRRRRVAKPWRGEAESSFFFSPNT